MKTDKTILKCPFCNGKAELTQKTECYGHGDYATETFVKCLNCHATSTKISSWDIPDSKEREDTAIKAWNRRN